jgi:catechol 2,3-dioxygenase-like lactoylglutathione lyase family enzyme
MSVKLDQINIVVRDMEAMTEFYRRLGLSIGTPTPEWAPHHRNSDSAREGHVDLDSQQFAQVWNQGWPGGPGLVIGFRVAAREDVDGLYDDLTTAGHTGQQPPYDAFWGARYAVVADPDGNAVGIMSEPDPARRTGGPEPPFS